MVAVLRRVSLTGHTAAIFSYVMPATLVAAMIAGLISVQATAEANVAVFANSLGIAYAVAAGIVGSLNPCGFFILPSYVAYQLGTEESGYAQQPASARVVRALMVAATATVGFLLVFVACGAITSAGGMGLIIAFPYLGLVVGLAVAGFGVYLIVTQRYVGIPIAGRFQVAPRRNLGNAFLFGIGYATGSLGCTLPIFMVVVSGSLATPGFFDSILQFVAYALGMGVVILAVTIGAALFRDAVSRWLRGALPHVHRVSSLFMVGAGAYLIWYWVVLADVLQGSM